jgi:hypothetical protein
MKKNERLLTAWNEERDAARAARTRGDLDAEGREGAEATR